MKPAITLVVAGILLAVTLLWGIVALRYLSYRLERGIPPPALAAQELSGRPPNRVAPSTTGSHRRRQPASECEPWVPRTLIQPPRRQDLDLVCHRATMNDILRGMRRAPDSVCVLTHRRPSQPMAAPLPQISKRSVAQTATDLSILSTKPAVVSSTTGQPQSTRLRRNPSQIAPDIVPYHVPQGPIAWNRQRRQSGSNNYKNDDLIPDAPRATPLAVIRTH